MCGIVGLLLRDERLEPDLGRLLVPMFDCMAERGPDSAGLAVFTRPLAEPLRRYSLHAVGQMPDWQRLAAQLREELHQPAAIQVRDNHALLEWPGEPDVLRRWLASFSSVRLLGVGRALAVFKDQGNPASIARRLGFAELAGTHGVGHTRMATESAVSPRHAHPFTADGDFCLVHNGSLSNPHLLRRQLEAAGLQFETDNDTEAACRYIAWRLSQGDTLEAALHAALQTLDGFYTLLIGTADSLTLLRDPFACKPAVVAETSRYVAVSSEFRSLAHLPQIEAARIFEPAPEKVYAWYR
jgi:amidophosphoribosyltransferase